MTPRRRAEQYAGQASQPPRAGVTYPLDALVSFHYYRNDRAMEDVVGTKRLRMIGDSGAFSAFTQGTPIRMPEYVAWCKQWGPSLCWYAALDVIGDPRATLTNWRAMRDRHSLHAVPTLHVGTDPRWMDHYVAEGCDFFGLGGMVGRALQSLPWVVKVFQYAKRHHPHVRFHIWGVTNRKFLDNIPAYSADSSGILGAPYRFALLRLFDPVTAKHITLDMDKRRVNVHKGGELLRRVYKIDPNVITSVTSENRALLIQCAARSTQLYAEWLQKRWGTTPPRWGIRHPAHLPPTTTAHGTRLHLVSARAGGKSDDLVTAAGLGTRIHLVDANAAHLASAAGGGPV